MSADDDDGVAMKQMFYRPPLILLQPRAPVKHFSLKNSHLMRRDAPPGHLYSTSAGRL
jgi:hypothetical protein